MTDQVSYHILLHVASVYTHMGCSLFLSRGTSDTPFNHASLAASRSAAEITWSGTGSACCMENAKDVSRNKEERERWRTKMTIAINREGGRQRESTKERDLTAVAGLFGFFCFDCFDPVAGLLGTTFWPLTFPWGLLSLSSGTGGVFLAPSPLTKSWKESNPTSLDAFQTADVKWSRRAREMNHWQTRG